MNTHRNNVDLAFATLDVTSYNEPQTAEDFRRAYKKVRFCLSADGVADLVAPAIRRIEALERALTPFAMHGGTMLHLRRLLNKEGRKIDLAGGVWFTRPNGPALLHNEILFFAAIDALGRAETRRVIAQDIARHDAARAVDIERDNY